MTDLTIQPAEAAADDTYMADLHLTTNYGTNASLLIGASATEIFRSLIRFDLTSISAGSTITSAVLSLYLASEGSTNACTLACYRVLRAWVEAEATGTNYVTGTGNNWGNSMCSNTSTDREAADIGTRAMSATETTSEWKDINLTAAKVQEWLDGVLANNGLLLRITTDTSAVTLYTFNSSGGANPPKLTITYEAGGASNIIIIQAS